MLALLSPRLWIALALAGALALSHFTVYRAGKNNVRLEWKAATAQANIESRALEQRRQDRADEAAKLGTARQARIRVDAAGSAGAVERLRDAIAARRMAEESASSATLRANTAEQLLIESAGAYQELAAAADRHVSDVQLLLDSWPK